jgi:hypothetical protein
MPVRKAIPEKDGVYFITFTCCNWLPLFELCDAYDAVYNWFNHLKQKGHYIIGHVIMPGHVHAVIAFGNTDKSIANQQIKILLNAGFNQMIKKFV